MERFARTVLGDVAADDLGSVLAHEHLIIDFSCRLSDENLLERADREFDISQRWLLVENPASDIRNLVRDSVEDAIDELAPFADAGGRTIVDVTTQGLGPNRSALQEVATRSGLNIIAGTGFYVHRCHTDVVHEASAEELAEVMIRDLREGDAAGTRAGVIGEIGVDGPETCEIKTVDAAAIASRVTGAPVSLHVLSGVLPQARPDTLMLVDRFEARGGNPARLILCHQDGSGDDPRYQKEVLRRGVTLEYDTFGFQTGFWRDGEFVQLPSDTQRIKEVANLWELGFGGQVLLSQDICYRMMTRQWGGWGFAHLFTTLRRRFESLELGKEEWKTMTIDTPARLLAFAE
jgi:phosphotriesterase-related protein